CRVGQDCSVEEWERSSRSFGLSGDVQSCGNEKGLHRIRREHAARTPSLRLLQGLGKRLAHKLRIKGRFTMNKYFSLTILVLILLAYPVAQTAAHEANPKSWTGTVRG